VREGLLNVEKHAGASTVVVSLGEVEGGVQVAVADDGAPVEAAGADGVPGTGLGLRMLVERAARLGGRVSLVHDEDGGTTLRMLLPAPGAGWTSDERARQRSSVQRLREAPTGPCGVG
jgi:signal transduction histidine kinase